MHILVGAPLGVRQGLGRQESLLNVEGLLPAVLEQAEDDPDERVDGGDEAQELADERLQHFDKPQ